MNELWSRGRDTTFRYDANGNVVRRDTDGHVTGDPSIADPAYSGGRTALFTFDGLDRETKTLVCPDGQRTCQDSTTGARKTTSAYFDSDQLSQQVKSNGVKEERFYFNDGRLALMRRQRPGETTFFKNQDYTYDGDGNRTKDERGDYVFNARDQLVKWTRAAGRAKAGTTVTYTVDGAGRITQRSDTGGTTSTFNYLGNRLVDEVTGGTRFLYDYDEFGSVTRIHSETPGFDQRFSYDAFERLTTTTSNVPTSPPAGTELGARYEYDALDRRDRKVVSAQGQSDRTLDLSYVGLTDRLSRQEQAGGEATYFDYDSGLNRLGLKRGANPFKVYGEDASGSVEELEDGAGQRERYFYDPFGALEPQSSPPPGNTRPDEERAEGELSADARANPFRFQGHYYDSGMQAYDMQAREYVPRVGRFLSQDRYEDSAADLALVTDPLTSDRYAFAAGDPIDNTEYDGHYAAAADQTSQYIQTVGGDVQDRQLGRTISGPHRSTSMSARSGYADNRSPTTSSRPYLAQRIAASPVASKVIGDTSIERLRQMDVGVLMDIYQGTGAYENAGILDFERRRFMERHRGEGPDWFGFLVGDSPLEIAINVTPLRGANLGRRIGTGIFRAIRGAHRAERAAKARSFEVGDLPAGVMGTTDEAGKITVARGLSGRDLEETLRHETVHSVLTPRRGPFVGARRAVRGALYERSHLARYAEEALAEGYATRSIRGGLRFPFQNGYVSWWRVGLEGGAVGGAAAYGGSR